MRGRAGHGSRNVPHGSTRDKIHTGSGALRHCPQAKSFYERKKQQRNAVVATMALAHKLARACYHMLKLQQPFCVERCFA